MNDHTPERKDLVPARRPTRELLEKRGYLPNPNKDKINREKHNISFRALRRFEWDSALEAPSVRHADDEYRTKALGFIGERIYVFVFVRKARRIRPISLRAASRKEVKSYVDFYE